jgi:tetratricopeptide (TPR) repeat protein
LLEQAALTKPFLYLKARLIGLERQNGPEAPELAECLQNLADAYQSVGRYDDSLRTNWRLVRIGEKILGRVHPDMVSMLLKIAETNEMMGKTEDALHIVESAIATAKQCMQADNPLAVRLIERHTYLVNLMRNQGAMRSQYDDPSIYQGQAQQGHSAQSHGSSKPTNSLATNAANIGAEQTGVSEVGTARTAGAQTGSQTSTATNTKPATAAGSSYQQPASTPSTKILH